MKNVLFATTAIVAVAGAASAQTGPSISFSGLGELGVTYLEDVGNTGATEFMGFNNVELYVSMAGTSDYGITFGAEMEFYTTSGNDDNGPVGDAMDFGGFDANDFSAFVSGAFGTFTGGNTDGAFDRVMFEAAEGGLNDEALASVVDSAYDTGQIFRYEYSTQGFTGAISWGTTLEDIGVGVQWSGDLSGFNVGVGAAYQVADTVPNSDLFGVSASVGTGPVAVVVAYQNASDVGIQDIDGSATYTSGMLTVGANVSYNLEVEELNRVGVFADYDMGGGLVMRAAVGDRYDAAGNSTGIRAGVGFEMNF